MNRLAHRAQRRNDCADLGFRESGDDSLGRITAGLFPFENKRYREQQGESAVQRPFEQCRRRSGRTSQSSDDYVGVEDEAHLLQYDIL